MASLPYKFLPVMPQIREIFTTSKKCTMRKRLYVTSVKNIVIDYIQQSQSKQ